MEDQREAWEAARPAHYAYDYAGTGFSPLRGPYRIEVRGEEVISVAYPSEGAAYELPVERAPTIEDLFDTVASGMENSDLDVDVEYDPQWHFPKRAYFDIGEEGDGFTAENFTPLED